MRTKSLALSCATIALMTGAAWAAPEAASIPILDHLEDSTLKHADVSGPANSANQLLKHQRNVERIAAAAAGGGAGHVESRDEGDIAVLVDDGIIVTPARAANLYDLPAGTSISYTPGVDSFSVSAALRIRSWSQRARANSVLISPGAMQFARIPSFPHVFACTWVSMIIAAFETE